MKKGWAVIVFGIGLLLGGCSGEWGDPVKIDPMFSSEPSCPDELAGSEELCAIYYQAMERVLRAVEDSPCGQSGLAYREILHAMIEFTTDAGFAAQVTVQGGYVTMFQMSLVYLAELSAMS